jgi:hypothetical protein
MTDLFASGDDWQIFVDASWSAEKKITGYTSEQQCELVRIARALGAVTVEEALRSLAGSKEVNGLRFLAQYRLPMFSPDMRLLVVSEVAKLDPAFAGLLYLYAIDLTDAEDDILVAAFTPEMPILVKKLKAGAVVRAKVSRV